MPDLLTCHEAAKALKIDLLNLVDILSIGDIQPAKPDGITGAEAWARYEEIRLSPDDIELIKAELRRRSFADFKATYSDIYQPSTSHKARGLEFGPGWIDLLIDYADGLRALNDRWKNEHARLRWGKEKFGALHLYSDYLLATEPAVINMHRKAYRESLKTCQECGAPGRLRFGHAICLTLCEKHAHLVGEPDPTRDGIILDLDAWMRGQREEE